MAQPLPVVINLSSGPWFRGDDAVVGQASEAFKQAGLDARVRPVGPEGIMAALERAADAAPGRMVVGGGDGTISAAAALAVERGLALGVWPVGTMNHFAKDLGMPLDLDEAAQVMARDQRKEVDLGQVNGRYFINNLSLGLYPRAVRERRRLRGMAWIGRFPRTIWGLGKALLAHPQVKGWLELEGRRTSIATPLLFVGNNRYLSGEGGLVGREALDQGGLSLFWAPRAGAWGLVRALAASVRGRDYPADLAAHWVTEARLESRRSHVRAVCDGELIKLAPPLEIAVRPGALEVVAP